MGTSKNTSVVRDSFSSKFGVIAAAAGSAVGLGNVWRFPYIAGEGGGSAFLIIYYWIYPAAGHTYSGGRVFDRSTWAGQRLHLV